MNVKDIISRMTIEEKFTLLTGKNNFQTVAIERLGIPSIAVSDGPHGVRILEDGGKVRACKAVCFPTSSAMAATWNPGLVRSVGKALGEECGALGVDILAGPGTNIKRTPLCGRNFEYYSEDPLLAGELSAAFIEGVQGEGVGASLKHFAANNQEFDRLQISSEVDIRALREIYFKPFEIAVRKSRPWTVMCAYNRLNGIFCSENKSILNDILRDEWGFDGFVVSDWHAVHDRVKSLKASLELEMPFNDKSAAVLKEAYEKGKITEDEINSALERLLNIVFRISSARSRRLGEYNAESHHGLAKEAALEAITLLKNEDMILPVTKEKAKRVAVIGQFAMEPAIQGSGSSRVIPGNVDSPLERILELAGNDIEVEFSLLYDNNFNGADISIKGLNKAMEAAMNADIVIVFVGNYTDYEAEGYDRRTMKLLPEFENCILRVSAQNPNTVVVVQAGSAIDMSAWIDKVKGVVFAWFTGQAGGSALAEILFGLASPSGKTAETFPVRIEDTPAYGTYPGNGYASWYSEGIMTGYRYYDTYDKDVLFPFGHGLSYTAFEYSCLRISPEAASEGDTVTVGFKIRNSGGIRGKETFQLYVRDMVCKVLRPYKELKAFGKVDLGPGEEKEVFLKLDRDAFAYFNASLNAWHVESGVFQILIGSSSRDIRLKGSVNIKALNDFS
ncbi:MAG: glycosyl hydrolase [Ruminiclostridium sp.]|nr:glycosyl hydrolase [Ruminiclostridium sp.]